MGHLMGRIHRTHVEQLAELNEKINPIVASLRALGISVKYDNADNRRPGFKFADYELKGVPVRLAIGARDLENGTVEVMRRDTLEKHSAPLEGIENYVKDLLEDIQTNIYRKALKHREEMTRTVETYDESKETRLRAYAWAPASPRLRE